MYTHIYACMFCRLYAFSGCRKLEKVLQKVTKRLASSKPRHGDAYVIEMHMSTNIAHGLPFRTTYMR